MDTKYTSLMVPKDLHRKLKAVAQKDHRALQFIVERILREALKGVA